MLSAYNFSFSQSTSPHSLYFSIHIDQNWVQYTSLGRPNRSKTCLLFLPLVFKVEILSNLYRLLLFQIWIWWFYRIEVIPLSIFIIFLYLWFQTLNVWIILVCKTWSAIGVLSIVQISRLPDNMKRVSFMQLLPLFLCVASQLEPEPQNWKEDWMEATLGCFKSKGDNTFKISWWEFWTIEWIQHKADLIFKTNW